jgi:hypothetical protein
MMQPADPLIILAPPRSFTSLVCHMIGQHPQLYGLPEVNLFLAETMRERDALLMRQRQNDGLLRAIAELFADDQTWQTIALARHWLDERTNSSWRSVFEELRSRAAPRRLVEKSPLTVLRVDRLYRLSDAFPEARYIHLLRHPRAQGESLWRIGGGLAAYRLDGVDRSGDFPIPDPQRVWYNMQVNIVTFLAGIPKDQWVRIRGEDILEDPDYYLREIATWLDISTDSRAIEAMKHPERSPFARIGPSNAPFGNDPEFLQSPALRNSGEPSPKASLDGPLTWREDGKGFSDEVADLARTFGYS